MILLSIISLVFSVTSMVLQFYLPKKYERLRKRNEEVYEFRKWVLDHRYDLYVRLPDYETMLYDKRPITLETYFPEISN